MPDLPQASEQMQIPPQVLAALQQQTQGMNGGDITSILAQLAQMSPDEMSAALQQLGVNIQPDQLVSAAENWLDQAADTQAGTGDSAAEEATETPAQAQQEQDDGGDDGGDGQSAQADTVDEGTLPPGATPASFRPQAAADEAESQPTNTEQVPNMPTAARGRMPPSAAMQGAAASGAGTMDDLVSAALMQSAAGNPNANVPMPRLSRPTMKGAATSLGNTRTANPASTRSRKRG